MDSLARSRVPRDTDTGHLCDFASAECSLILLAGGKTPWSGPRRIHDLRATSFVEARRWGEPNTADCAPAFRMEVRRALLLWRCNRSMLWSRCWVPGEGHGWVAEAGCALISAIDVVDLRDVPSSSVVRTL